MADICASEHVLDDDNDIAAALYLQFAAIAELESRRIAGGSIPGKRANIDRVFYRGHRQIMWDCFWPRVALRDDGSEQAGPVYTDRLFERRLRMPRDLFYFLLVAITADSDYIRAGLRPYCMGKIGLNPLQKIVGAIRQITYGVFADATDEYVRMVESTARRSLTEFCKSVDRCFAKTYLRNPTLADVKKMERQFSAFGFHDCIGVVDCAGWNWENCPKALQWIMVGKESVPAIGMDVVSDLDLPIWHCLFWSPRNAE